MADSVVVASYSHAAHAHSHATTGTPAAASTLSSAALAAGTALPDTRR